ncbi:MAG: hypothetical protein M3Z64_12185 [Verrucomicrobiota bacterium]|nr:hypothetical protein [Verrucomicrobiota bacterium]
MRSIFFALLAVALATETVHAAESSFFKGVTVSCQTSGVEWQTPEMEKTLAELHSLGVNSVAIHPYAQVREDGHVFMWQRSGTDYITTPLSWAHQLGMSTMLIPHIAYWGTKFSWRGEINFETTAEWDCFFNDYQTWIVEMAKLAETQHSELFCVGLEFSYAEKFPARWRKIIAAVREVYHGKLTYGANWNEYENVKFWDALDYIGVLAYFPLTKSPDPSAAEIAAAWATKCTELERFSAKNGGKRFVFTEIGYNESARAAAEPWAFKTGGEHAAEIQQRCIEVALALPQKMPCLAGMFWWKWFPELPHHHEENYRLQTPEIKALIAKHWRE